VFEVLVGNHEEEDVFSHDRLLSLDFMVEFSLLHLDADFRGSGMFTTLG
jgi:hypothetical protein